GHECRQAIIATFRPAHLNRKVLAFDPAQLAQPLPECWDTARCRGRRLWTDEAEPHNLLWRLRQCRETEAEGADNGCQIQHHTEPCELSIQPITPLPHLHTTRRAPPPNFGLPDTAARSIAMPL